MTACQISDDRFAPSPQRLPHRLWFAIAVASSIIVVPPLNLPVVQGFGHAAAETPFVVASNAKPFDLEAGWRKIGLHARDPGTHHPATALSNVRAESTAPSQPLAPIVSVALDALLALPELSAERPSPQQPTTAVVNLEQMGLASQAPPPLGVAVRLNEGGGAPSDVPSSSHSSDALALPPQQRVASGDQTRPLVAPEQRPVTDAAPLSRSPRRPTTVPSSSRTWRHIVTMRQRLAQRRAASAANLDKPDIATADSPFAALHRRTP